MDEMTNQFKCLNVSTIFKKIIFGSLMESSRVNSYE